jgi:hypothetical protein
VCMDVGHGKGKGLVATRAWHPNDEILRERPYVAVQSPESCKNVLACANCFRFVGAFFCSATLHYEIRSNVCTQRKDMWSIRY